MSHEKTSPALSANWLPPQLLSCFLRFYWMTNRSFRSRAAPDFPAVEDLRGRTVPGANTGESPALLGQLLQQRSRLPEYAMLPLKFADAVIHFSKAHGIREPHRA